MSSLASANQSFDPPILEQLAELVSPSTVIVCVGNDLCGDDGAGVAVARRLAGSIPWEVYETRTAPESFVIKIAQRKPDVVVLIDALDFRAEPGTVRLIQTGVVGGQSPSTHGPAPLAFLELLNILHPCRCVVLGIQPQHVNIGKGLSGPVAAAVELVVRVLQNLATDYSDEYSHGEDGTA